MKEEFLIYTHCSKQLGEDLFYKHVGVIAIITVSF